MKKFINMDFNGTQWWVEYEESGESVIEYFDTKEEAVEFYNSII